MCPLQATIALLKDGTIAVEVNMSLALVQWPFLTDISLAWAAASIFDPGSAGSSGVDPAVAAASSALDSILTSPERAPWLYFNCILRDSQLFVPVADPVSFSSPKRCGRSCQTFQEIKVKSFAASPAEKGIKDHLRLF